LLQRCWNIPGDGTQQRSFVSPDSANTVEIVKAALWQFKREQKARALAKRERQKGKNVPGKNLSKNSQCDGNDEEPAGRSKRAQRNRSAAKKARQSIAEQAPLIDTQLPKGDSTFVPVDEEEEEESDYDVESEDDESIDDDFESARSSRNLQDDPDPPDPVPPGPAPVKGDVQHCWVESFDLELNSKRVDQFRIPGKLKDPEDC